MKGLDFRQWIDAGLSHYGSDPWFFIRELAQNSRDASATAIHVSSNYTSSSDDGEEVIVFEDNGTGMSYNHALQFLFRLYASSKTNEKHAAGMFGIGFWTVLKYEPAAVIIESFFKKERWGVVLDESLNSVRIANGPAGKRFIDYHDGNSDSTNALNFSSAEKYLNCWGELKQHGTRITLIRKSRESNSEAFSAKIREALNRYCCFLRRNNSRGDILPVFFEGINIARPIKLPGPVSLSFKSGDVEGAVGLGPEPKVFLYARGLPVWEGTSLEELSHVPPEGGEGAQRKHRNLYENMDIGQGQAPVFIINGNNLVVNMSRKGVIDNKNLQRVRQAADDALMQLVERAADFVSPRGMMRWFLDFFKRSFSSVLHSIPKMLLVTILLIVPLEIAVIWYFVNSNKLSNSSIDLAIEANKPFYNAYNGATVNTLNDVNPPEMMYYPPVRAWFKLFSADRYTLDKGFLQDSAEVKAVEFPKIDCGQRSVAVELAVKKSPGWFLPQPIVSNNSQLAIDPTSIRLNGVPVSSVEYSERGDAVVALSKDGMLRYRCCPVYFHSRISAETVGRLTALPPEFQLPPDMDRVLQQNLASGDVESKVTIALRLTDIILKYDDSAGVAERYSRGGAGVPWFNRVLSIGAGDCDVLNGVLCVFLRRMNVPCRLAIGMVGEGGKIVPGLHAWAEYFDNGWKTADATPLAFAPNRGVKPKATERTVEGGRNVPGDGFFTGKYVLVGLIGLFVCVIAAIIVLIFKLKRGSSLNKKEEMKKKEMIQVGLAGMVLHELLHPGAWGHNRGIRYYKLLPTIGDSYISLRVALKYAGKRRLFTLNRATGLSDVVINGLNGVNIFKRRIIVLDAGNAAFAPVIKLLPGAIHLERVLSLNAVRPEKVLPKSLAMMVMAADECLKRLGRGVPRFLIATGPISGDFFDVDLDFMPSMDAWGIPNRFIAVNSNSPNIGEWAVLYQRNPHLALFKFIHAAVRDSDLFPEPSEGLLEGVSKQLILEMGGSNE